MAHLKKHFMFYFYPINNTAFLHLSDLQSNSKNIKV